MKLLFIVLIQEKNIKSQDKYSDEKGEDLINAALNQFYASDEYKSKDRRSIY